jgi:starch phosphorylase
MPRVAYFCMEYGLHEEFAIYSGGLGILAGDHLKASADQNLPVVGIGLLWRQGYTTQLINAEGRPYDVFPVYAYDFLHDTGVEVAVKIRGQETYCKVWMVDKYGNAPLYLLDTNVPRNGEREKWINFKLYGGNAEARIAQEMVLGIGGVRALRELGIEVDVYHFNEGHAVFAGVELIREKMARGMNFARAWDEAREQIVFTTHTPVPAGNECHPHRLLEDMGAYNGLNRKQMKTLGGDPFGMTVAGLRLARRANAVAELHGQTARKMWSNIQGTAPISHITNGVHCGTWQDTRIRSAYENGEDLWAVHQQAKQALIRQIGLRTSNWLDPEVLLIGFARRAATYKRSDLIFGQMEILEPWLNRGQLQLVFSGKAHPQDEKGKKIISRLVSLARQYPHRVVFLENYDMKLGRLLTRGCDVWLNNPRRPQEASGTSGMKAAMNGVLNLSVLDGWWPEGCQHGVNGWQIGDGYEGPGQDEHDRKCLYRVLQEEVMLTYYNNRARWVQMMRASIDMAHWNFSSQRMVQDYNRLLYSRGESERLIVEA